MGRDRIQEAEDEMATSNDMVLKERMTNSDMGRRNETEKKTQNGQ